MPRHGQDLSIFGNLYLNAKDEIYNAKDKISGVVQLAALDSVRP